MLTRQQHHLLGYLRNYHASTGIMPSYDEMTGELGLKSKSGIHRLISALEERGAIRRLRNRARAIEVLRTDFAPPALLPPPVRTREAESVPNAVVPLLAAPPSGPIGKAIGDRIRNIEVPGDYVGPGVHFALAVTGDAMRGAGILDGDVAVFRQQVVARPRDIVVAVVEEADTLVRRYVPRGSSVILQAEHPGHEPVIAGFERVQVRGRLATILRDYR